jgi:hypothetical protein
MKRSDIKTGAELTATKDFVVNPGSWEIRIRKGCPITVLSVDEEGIVNVDSLGMKITLHTVTLARNCSVESQVTEPSATDVIDETVRVYIAERLAPSDELCNDVNMVYTRKRREGDNVDWNAIRDGAVDCAVKYAEYLVDELYEQNEDYE